LDRDDAVFLAGLRVGFFLDRDDARRRRVLVAGIPRS
jgi:hypothetical protein